MAEVSNLQQPHGNDDDKDEVVVSFHPHNLDSSFGVYSSEFTDRNPRSISPNVSALFDRENQINFVIDMFHQRVEQSQSNSTSRVISDSDLGNCDRNSRLTGRNDVTDSNNSETDFDLGLGLGFPVEENNNRNDNSGFMLADCSDDFFESTTIGGNPRSESVTNLGSDTHVAGENEIDFGSDPGCDAESNLRFSWDAFHPEDENNRVNNQDLDWEEVDDREILNMNFESEADDDISILPENPNETHELDQQQEEEHEPDSWEVLLDAHNLESGQYDEYNYGEYDMLFEQFAETDATSLGGRPPAARLAVENLLSVMMTEMDLEKNNTMCAVCKDEMGVGLMAKQLSCGHRYHGDCIVPWLGIRNTCPVCRHELPTDDPNYERRRLR